MLPWYNSSQIKTLRLLKRDVNLYGSPPFLDMYRAYWIRTPSLDLLQWCEFILSAEQQ